MSRVVLKDMAELPLYFHLRDENVTAAECLAWLEQSLETWAEHGNRRRARRARLLSKIHEIVSEHISRQAKP